eukprot:COSAG02_NODE_5444_length_4320_cov_2.196873_2_plen_149_part_00
MEAALAVDRAALAAATEPELEPELEPEPEPEPEPESTDDPIGGRVLAGKKKIYIVKPALGLQGTGIELTTDPDNSAMATEGGKGVVQVRRPPATAAAAAAAAAGALTTNLRSCAALCGPANADRRLQVRPTPVRVRSVGRTAEDISLR